MQSAGFRVLCIKCTARQEENIIKKSDSEPSHSQVGKSATKRSHKLEKKSSAKDIDRPIHLNLPPTTCRCDTVTSLVTQVTTRLPRFTTKNICCYGDI